MERTQRITGRRVQKGESAASKEQREPGTLAKTSHGGQNCPADARERTAAAVSEGEFEDDVGVKSLGELL